MNVTLKIVRGPSGVTVTTKPGDVIDWEEFTGKPYQDLRGGVSMRDLWLFAYFAETRDVDTPPSFAVWRKTVDDVESIEAPSPDPTPPSL